MSVPQQLDRPVREGLPPWALDWVGRGAGERELARGDLDVVTNETERGLLASVRVRDAGAMAADDLVRSTVAVYGTLRELLRGRPDLRPIRIWNFVPGILHPAAPYRHRYMAFNAGRYEAIRAWTEEDGRVEGWLPTSSGVGSPTPDLVVHLLAADRAPVPVENPRQVPAYRYSSRYGPRPPCFSRAVRVPVGRADDPDDALLLLGGTASVVGEESLHPGDLDAQLGETMDNLAALIAAGLPGIPASTALASVVDAVVYHVRERDRAAIEREVRARFPRARALAFLRTPLCRDDLLVEIEGVASPKRGHSAFT